MIHDCNIPDSNWDTSENTSEGSTLWSDDRFGALLRLFQVLLNVGEDLIWQVLIQNKPSYEVAMTDISDHQDIKTIWDFFSK